MGTMMVRKMTNTRIDNNNNNNNSENKRTKKNRRRINTMDCNHNDDDYNNNTTIINNNRNKNIITEFSEEEEEKNIDEESKSMMAKIITYVLYDEFNEINMFRIKYKLSHSCCSFIPVANNVNNMNDKMNENDTNHKNNNSNNNDNNNNSYQMKKPNIDLIIDNAIRLSNENLFIQWQLRMINNDDDECKNPKHQYPLFKIFPDKIHEVNNNLKPMI